MKKLTKINLHSLSQAEMADRELNLLKGGSGMLCACVGVCMGDSCACDELGDSGTYPLSTAIQHLHDTGDNTEEQVSGVGDDNNQDTNNKA